MSLLGLPLFWGWLGTGIALIALEVLVAPGTFLLWIGLAALAMALLASFVTLSTFAELTIFGVLALAFGIVGWKVYGARRSGNDAARDLHDPAVTFIGRELVLFAAIENGAGQVKVGDSVWRVTGPELPAGARVRVKGLDGATLEVEPA
jgi:hypothetical protein